jgi:flagellar hook-associated protein 1 FlgK
MPTFPTNILGSLHLGRRALIAHQTALDTIGHNLANVTTPGYTRQRADLAPVVNRGGVDVEEIRRLRDRFVDFSLLTEQQALGKSEAQSALMQRLQAVFNDPPGTGLGSTLDAFFQGFQDVSVTPTDQVARVTVKDRAERLTSTFASMRQRLETLKVDLTTDIQQKVTEANRLMSQIAELHVEIIAARNGPAPNDLFDRRDRLVGELAQIVGVMPTDRPDGTVQLAMTGTGVLLVDGMATAPLAASLDGAADTVDLTAGAAALPVSPRSGALASVVTARNAATGVLKQAIADLDALAAAVATEVNRVHASGSGLAGHATLTSANAVTSSAVPLTAAGLADTPVTGSFRVLVHDTAGAVVSNVAVAVTAGVTTLDAVRAALDADPNLTAAVAGGRLTLTAAGAGRTFTFAADSSDTLMALGLNTVFTGRTASTIALDPVLAADVSKIAAARADAAGLVHPGDGANALAIARLRTAPTMSGGTASFTDFFGAAVGRVGSAARDAIEAADRQQATVAVVSGFQQQASGVSSDEELIALSQTQTAYAAAARFVTTIDDVIQTLLAMGA